MALENEQLVHLWLTQAIDRLQQTFPLEQIILFGSWARGTASRRSDLDLFIVWETDYLPLERINRILVLLQDAPLPIEVMVYTPDELKQRLYSPFIRRILQEGRVLYERGKAAL